MLRAKGPKPRQKPRVARTADLLSRAHPSEIEWADVAPFLRDRQVGSAPFVYFVTEQPEGAVKIGEASDPIKRLRQLQTGNPRRLKIERLIYGNRHTEALLHEYFSDFVVSSSKHRSSDINPRYAVETEWFKPEAREQIIKAADEIGFRQLTEAEFTLEDMERIVGKVLEELGYRLKRIEPVNQLGEYAGYVERKLRA